MSKYARRKDNNHDDIKRAFEQAGWTWIDMFRFPAQLDGEVIKRGPNKRYCVIRVEVKNGLSEVLTDKEEKFIDAWPGHVIVAYTPTDAIFRANGLLESY